MEEVICQRCGLVDDYRTTEAGPHIKAICNGCDRYIKILPQHKSTDLTLYFGKYKGRKVSSLTNAQELSWLQWAIENCSLKPGQKEAFHKQLEKFKSKA